MRKSFLAVAVTALVAAAPAHAVINSFVATLYGSNEVAGGDPDGFGLATVVIDVPTNTVSWAILANNIAMPLTGAHIHSAPAGVNGSIIINFNGQLTGTVVDPDAASITPLNAADFYVNLHNADFTGGAIRGQLMFVASAVPEPATYGLMFAGLGAVGLLARRRRPAD